MMTEYIDDFNWRVHLVTHITKEANFNGIKYDVGTPISLCSRANFKSGKHISFLTPSISAVFLNISDKNYRESESYMAFKSFRKFGKDKNTLSPKNEEDFYTCLEQRINSIVCAVSGLEAFLNSYIPKDFKYKQINKRKTDKVLTGIQIERLSLGEKVGKVYPQILNKQDFKISVWKSFSKIKDIRHKLLHLKNVDFRNSNLDENTIWNEVLDPKLRNPALIVKDIMEYLSQGNERFLNKTPF